MGDSFLKNHITKYKVNFKNSVYFRLTITILALLIPVNLLLFIYTWIVLSNASIQVRIEEEHILKEYVNQLDTTMNEISQRLYRMTSDSHMLYIRQTNSENSKNNFQWHGAYRYLYNMYTEYLQDYPLISGIYSYITYEGSSNECIIKSATDYTNKDINSIIIQKVSDISSQNQKYNIPLNTCWETMSYNNRSYIFLIRKIGNCYFGAWMSTDNIISYWKLDNNQYLFVDNSDRIISAGTSSQAEYIYPEDKKHCVIKSSSVGEYSLVKKIKPSFLILQKTPIFIIILCTLAFFAICIIPILIHALKKYVIVPVNNLLDGMKEVKTGNFTHQIFVSSKEENEFSVLTMNFNSMVRQIHDLKIESYEKELERQNIKMRYLSQQIQPHFILNALNILYCYNRNEFSLIQDMILCLTKYFRYIVKVNVDFAKLGHELAHIDNYLKIQKIRYMDYLNYEIDLEKGLEDYAIPPLLIQNFTENAVKYSISMNEAIHIYVSVWRIDKEYFQIRIADTGKGLPEDILNSIEIFKNTHKYQDNLGVGIQNAIERLEIMYHQKASISFSNSAIGGAVIDIVLPCIEIEKVGEDDE